MITAYAIEGLVSASALLALAYGPWQWVCTDVARQRMFKARDELFDMAAAGYLDFESSEYQTIRSEINNMIRFAHGLTWVRLLMFSRLARRRGPGPVPVYAAMNRIGNKATKDRVKAVISDVETAAVSLVLMKSPFLVVFGVVTVLPMLIVAISYIYSRDILSSIVSDLGNLIQSEADYCHS
ncbi:MAG: hypothetical protein ACRYHQ_14080 [Janthinobacterium lividum]